MGTAAISDGDYVHVAISHADLIIMVGHDVVEKPPFFMHPKDTRKVIKGFEPTMNYLIICLHSLHAFQSELTCIVRDFLPSCPSCAFIHQVPEEAGSVFPLTYSDHYWRWSMLAPDPVSWTTSTCFSIEQML